MTISNALLTFIFILFVLFDPNLSKTLQSIKFFFFLKHQTSRPFHLPQINKEDEADFTELPSAIYALSVKLVCYI